MSYSLYAFSFQPVLSSTSANPVWQQLHQENVDLKRALKKSTPGGNPRAEAAERSLFEIRKTMVCLAIETVPLRFVRK